MRGSERSNTRLAQRVGRFFDSVRTIGSRSPQIALLRVLPSVHPLVAAGFGFLVVLSAALPTIQIYTSSVLIASVPGAATQGMDSPAGRRLLTFLVLTAIVLVISQAVGQVRWTVGAGLGARLGLHLRERVMRAVSGPPGVSHLEDPSTLDLVAGASGFGTGRYPVDNSVPWLADSLVSRLGTAGPVLILGAFRWWAAAILVACQIVARQVRIRFAIQRTSVAFEEGQVLRRADYYRDLALTPGAAKETRVFDLGAWVGQRFHDTWLDVMERMWRRRAWLWPKMLLVDMLLLSAYLVSLLAVANAARTREIGLALVAMLVQSVFATNAIWQDSGNFQLLFALAPLRPLVMLEQRIATSPTGAPARTDATGLPAREVRFEGVSFRYPGLSGNVLDSLDLVIPAGRSLAIVGPNGAGKTTLVKLLARLYEPDSGRITVDGIDLSGLDHEAWRHQIAVIFQDFVCYQLPATDNVGFGALPMATDTRALERAARRAGATDIIDGLPAGWDTVLSRQFTGGADLSGGQWQRVALARAMFAVEAGARILVMDEPTANLDVRAEADFFERFLDITHGLTTIVISHRFSTVRRADEICVLEGAGIVERGTHDELMHAAGRYATMFSLQASMFSEDDTEGAGA